LVELDVARAGQRYGQKVVQRAELRIRDIPLIFGDAVHRADDVFAEVRVELDSCIDSPQPFLEVGFEFCKPTRAHKCADYVVCIGLRDVELGRPGPENIVDKRGVVRSWRHCYLWCCYERPFN
jgi:hypothetical protein